ncbi:MAG: hypothetical protein ACRDYD_10950 [Acidimicrobiales bacterium]
MTAGSSATMGVGSPVRATATELRDQLAGFGQGATWVPQSDLTGV